MHLPRSIVFLPVVLILLLLIIIVGSSNAVPTPTRMYYIPDPAHNAGCWITSNGNGISCLYQSFETPIPTPNSFERRIYNGY